MGRNSSVPLYKQIVDDIKRQIASGELQEGSQLMTEQNLGDAYKVSRITVRKAIDLLVEDGYVTKQQGIGTFVEKKKLRRTFENRIMSFSELCQAEGKTPSSELILLEWIRAKTRESSQLQVEEGARVLKIVRVRKSDDMPVMLEESYFPSKYGFLAGENLNESIYKALRDHGVVIENGINTLDICYATKDEAEYLQVSAGQALLLHKELSMDSRGFPVHYSRLIVNPERYVLTLIT